MNSIDGKLTGIKVLISFFGIRTLTIAIVALLCVTLLFNNLVLGWGRHISIFYFYFVAGGAIIIYCIALFFSNGEFLNRIDVAFIALTSYLISREAFKEAEMGYSDQHLTYICLGCLYFVFKATIQRVGAGIFVRTIALLGFVNALYGLLQYANLMDSNNSDFRIAGFFSNPGPFAAYLTLTIPFVILSGEVESKLFRIMSFCVLFASLAAIVLSFSRASLLTSVVSVCLSLKHLNAPILQKLFCRRNCWIAFFVFACLILFLSFLFCQKSNSTLGRLLIWDVCADMFKNSWLFGLGLGEFEIQYPNYQAAYFSASTSERFTNVAGMTYYAFNDWFQIAIECGVCGLVLFIMLFYSVCTSCARKSSALAAKICIVTTTLVLALFFYPLRILPIQVILIFSLALLSCATQDRFSVPVITIRPRIARMLTLALAAMCIFALQRTISRYNAVRGWKAAYTTNLFDRRQGLILYKKLLPELKYNGEFLFNYGALLVEAGNPSEGQAMLSIAKHHFNHIDLYLHLGNAYKAMGKFKEADRNYEFASQMIPSRFYPKYLQAILYQEMHDTIRVQRKAKEIIDMEVKVCF